MWIDPKAAAGVAVAAVALACTSPASAQMALFASDSALRFQVTPDKAEVFLDGYYVGTVDDFNGMFQRLHVVPGEHDIEIYLAGFRSVRQKVFVQPRGDFRIRYMMEELHPGDTPDPRPVAPPPSPTPPPQPSAPPAPGERRQAPPPRPGAQSEFGSVAIRVQPRDAVVLIDGERWEAPSDNDRLVVQLPVGEHRVEIRKAGFGNYASTIEVRRAMRPRSTSA